MSRLELAARRLSLEKGEGLLDITIPRLYFSLVVESLNMRGDLLKF